MEHKPSRLTVAHDLVKCAGKLQNAIFDLNWSRNRGPIHARILEISQEVNNCALVLCDIENEELEAKQNKEAEARNDR